MLVQAVQEFMTSGAPLCAFVVPVYLWKIEVAHYVESRRFTQSSGKKGLTCSDSSGRNPVVIITLSLNLIHQATERISLLHDEKLFSFLNREEVTSGSAVITTLLASISSTGAPVYVDYCSVSRLGRVGEHLQFGFRRLAASAGPTRDPYLTQSR
ncbi:unnamed protein product [Echinostoma caproni]|uniref:TIR domain-containing protein n=1 Tax=Echinostoma caproni TaxID=27848 RepID=A0A183B9D1_9TREM|nr:unnamed protein product [Echinostoma caproni]